MTFQDNVEFVRKRVKTMGFPVAEMALGEECVLFKSTVGKFAGAFETYDVGVGVEEDCIRCRAVFPVAVQEARRRDVAEYIARANFELKFGSLQLNIEDGAIVAYLAYPMSAVLAEGDEAIKMAFGLPASLLDVHSNELIKIASGENE